ncbi:hypothetical protein [Bryobacter aggregatus]|uniref:hypothetical protein n=1 Tax=Bryobacter aggregatus TaxID=360054 RepID=UPI0004E1E578|nr:hypothetical protein [Bryobacter aggregatus]
MSEEYLWDRSGEPDPEIARLESLLQPYRYQTPKKRNHWAPLAIAASVALLAALGYWSSQASPSDWKIAGQNVQTGKRIETGQEPVKLEADGFGEVNLDPHSSLRVLAAKDGKQQLALQRGRLHAFIWAPPGNFSIDTPSAKSIDLGCAYTLSVLPDESGFLTVQSGWVAFQAGKIESFLPAGAACRTKARRGPGLPYLEDASPAFQAAVVQFEDSDGAQGVPAILAHARKEDALTLWHLMLRQSGEQRDRVIERFVALVPGGNESGLKSQSAAAIDAAWNELGYGATDWWRSWKHPWQTGAP